MFFEDFIKQYTEQLEGLKREYAEKEAALERSNETRISGEKEMLKGQFDKAVAALQADFDAKLTAYKQTHDSALEEQKAAFETYKQGVATRAEFETVEQRYAESANRQEKSISDMKQAQETALLENARKVRDAVSAVDAKLTGLEDFDADKINGKIKAMVSKIREMDDNASKKGTSVAALIFAILGFLAAGALAALLFIGKMPLDKYDYVTGEAMREAVAPLSEVQTAVAAHTEDLNVLTADPCADGHAFETLLTVPATEISEGYQIRQCSVCKLVQVDTIGQIVHGHSEGAEPFETDLPGLATYGTRYYHCDTCGQENCDKVITEQIPPILPSELIAPASENPAWKATEGLTDLGRALDPAQVNASLCPELPFDKDSMVWFVTNDGQYVLICSFKNANQKNDVVNKSIRTFSGVSGTWYQIKDNKSLLLVFVPDMPAGAQAPAEGTDVAGDQPAAVFTEPVAGLRDKIRAGSYGTVDIQVLIEQVLGNGRREASPFGMAG